MRILHIIPWYLPAKIASGPIIPTHNLNKELVKRGVEVVVYTTNFDVKDVLDVPLNQQVEIDRVKVFYFPVVFKPWYYSFKLHQALAKNIKNFDLVHITSVFLSISTLAAYYAKKFKKPYIISPHGSLMLDPLSRRFLKKKIYISLIEKRNLQNSSAIHFTVEKEKEEYLAAGFFLKKAIVIPNGIDLKNYEWQITNFEREIFCQNFGIESDKKIILFLGRLHPIKGLDSLIPAFFEVFRKEPKAVLVLAGPDEDNYKKEIELKIKKYQLRIGENIFFTGMLTKQDKILALKGSDIFVLPSYSENFGLVVVEAMCFGLPVVITKNVGIAVDVEKAGAGIVVEKNEKQLAEAILKILNNSDLKREIGEKARKLVEEKFDIRKIADKWEEEYKNIINNNIK